MTPPRHRLEPGGARRARGGDRGADDLLRRTRRRVGLHPPWRRRAAARGRRHREAAPRAVPARVGAGVVAAVAGDDDRGDRLRLGERRRNAASAASGCCSGTTSSASCSPPPSSATRWSARSARRRHATSPTGASSLLAAGAAAAAYGAWRLQDAVAPGRRRRFTGSYARASFSGNDFPTTVLGRRRSAAAGPRRARRRRPAVPLADLDAGHESSPRSTYTGGFHTTQRWRGVRLLDLSAAPSASHVRWSATPATAALRARRRRRAAARHPRRRRAAQPRAPAPVRLVAPGRRGWQWVKWVRSRSSSTTARTAALAWPISEQLHARGARRA